MGKLDCEIRKHFMEQGFDADKDLKISNMAESFHMRLFILLAINRYPPQLLCLYFFQTYKRIASKGRKKKQQRVQAQ